MNWKLGVILAFFINSSFILCSSTPEEDELKLVIEVCRHGTRDLLYPQYKVSSQTDLKGTGELTLVGIRQQYILGLELQNRYIHKHKLLSPSYNQHEISIQSTDSSRSIISARAQSLGLYPDTSPVLTLSSQAKAVPPIHIHNLEQIQASLLDSPLPYYLDPVPIHYQMDTMDLLLKAREHCSYIKHKMSQARSTEFVLQKEEFYKKELYPKLEQILNIAQEEFNVVKASDVYDTILCVVGNGYALHEGFDKSTLEMLVDAYYVNHYDVFYPDEKCARLANHFLFKEVLRYVREAFFDDVQDKESRLRKKFVLFSGHDTNVIPILIQFGIYYDIVPFSSNVIFHLFKKADSFGKAPVDLEMRDFYVEVKYNDKTLQMESEDKLDLDRFLAFLESKLYKEDFHQACFEDVQNEPQFGSPKIELADD